MNNDEILKENNRKKFDITMMNPPYSGNIELKFLEKVIQISDNVISIQPCEWLQKPANINRKSSSYNKYKDSICKYISDIDILEDAQNMFNIHGFADISIYVCNKTGGYDFDKIFWRKFNKEDYNKFINSAEQFPKLEEYDENSDKAFVNIKTFANDARTTRYNIVAPNTYKVIYKGKLPNGDAWNSKKYKSKSLSKEKPYGIYFNTYEEAINFYNSCLTECYKYIVSIFKTGGTVPLNLLPYMGDYSQPWDNERFFKYYNITDVNKQHEIINSMKPFMNDEDNL